MSRLATSFVLGYHGCDETIGRKAIKGDLELGPSKRKYDWLGSGLYFWESDPRRALEFSNWKVARGDYKRPFVLGAIIDLRNCLDLCSRGDLELVRSARSALVKMMTSANSPIPQNKSAPNDPNQDRALRYLDRAVIEHLHKIIKSKGQKSYDSVRGMFHEGGPLYKGSGFFSAALMCR